MTAATQPARKYATVLGSDLTATVQLVSTEVLWGTVIL